MTFDVCLPPFFRNEFVIFFCQCPRCQNVVLVTGTANFQTHNLINFDGDITELGIGPISVSPSNKPNAPRHTPEDVERHFIDGIKILSVDVSAAAGNCFRTALEKATDHLLRKSDEDSKVTAGSLHDRIKLLKKKNLITPQLIEWAEVIRSWGNMGTHGDPEFTIEQAHELKKFTEKFLEYVFTMPEEVKKAREKIESD